MNEHRKCNAYNCWCGGELIRIVESVKDAEGKMIYERLECGGAYLSTEGYTEHWKCEMDMLENYPDIASLVDEASHA